MRNDIPYAFDEIAEESIFNGWEEIRDYIPGHDDGEWIESPCCGAAMSPVMMEHGICPDCGDHV